MDSVELYQLLENRKRFDIDRDTVDTILTNQLWVCGICEQPFKKTPCIDHDHATDFVRGLLCVRCNTGLGQLRDDIHVLARAIVYLQNAEQRYNKHLLSLEVIEGRTISLSEGASVLP
jgi:hypothetical protein